MLVDFADSRERVGQRSGTSGLIVWRDTPALFGPSHLPEIKVSDCCRVDLATASLD